MSGFELFKNQKTKKYYFRLKASNGIIILTSQGYKSKQSAMKGIKAVVDACKDGVNFYRKVAKDGSHYFVLKSTNGKIIGKSTTYKSRGGRELAIKSVSRNAKVH